MRISLRVYGNQSPTSERDCKDTQLIVDFDDPFVSLPPTLTDEQRRKIYSGNARALYRLD